MSKLQSTDLTIAIATHNGENFVARTVASALATGAHVVVSDDASTDGTSSILAQFSPRVELHLQPRNQGIAKQNQFLLDACTTPLMMMLNQDDLVVPKRLLGMKVAVDEVNVMNGWIINGRGARVRPIYRRPPVHVTTRGVFKGLQVENFIMSPSQVIFPPQLAREAGGFELDGDPGQGADDWMCWLRLASAGVSFRLHMRPAMAYRVHDANYSHQHASHLASRQTVRRAFPAPPLRDRRLRIAW